VAKPGSRLLVSALLCAVVSAVILRYGARLYTNSSDLGWHYSLANFIAHSGILPTPADRFLGPMIGYPPLSHIIAAVAGKWNESPLTAMHILALLSALGCYLIFFSRLITRSILCCGIFIGILYLIRLTGGGVLGYEIISNAFYPQLIGTFVYLLSLMFLLFLVRRPIWYVLLGVATVWAVAWIHLLPAVLLAFSAIALFPLLNGLKGNLIWTIAISAALPLILIAHPTFWMLVDNAQHEGGFFPSLPRWYPPIIACFSFISSLIVLRYFRTDASINDDIFLVAISLSCTLALSLQLLFYYGFGVGSAYAGMKYIFISSTAFSAVMSLTITNFLENAVKHLIQRGSFRIWRWLPVLHLRSTSLVVRAGMPIILAGATVVLVFGRQPSFSLDAFSNYDSDAKALSKAALPADLMYNVLSLNDEFNAGANFAVMATHFKAGWNASGDEVFKVLLDGDAAEGTKYALVSKEQWRRLADQGVEGDCLVPAPSLKTSTLILARCFPSKKHGMVRTSCTNIWTANEPVRGFGFDEPDIDQFGALRWTTSLGAQMAMSELCTSSDYIVRVVVAFAVTSATLESFALEIDDELVPLNRKPSSAGQLYQGMVRKKPGTPKTNGQVSLRLSVARLDKPAADNRHLGIAVRSIEFLVTDQRL